MVDEIIDSSIIEQRERNMQLACEIKKVLRETFKTRFYWIIHPWNIWTSGYDYYIMLDHGYDFTDSSIKICFYEKNIMMTGEVRQNNALEDIRKIAVNMEKHFNKKVELTIEQRH